MELPLSLPSDALQASLSTLTGLTAYRLELLNRLGLFTIGDLLFHFPRSYEDLTNVRTIGELTEGTTQTVRGEVIEIESRSLSNGGFVVSVVLSDDGTQILEGVWFNQARASQAFRYGQWVAFSGKPKWFRDHWQMANPRTQELDGPDGPLPGLEVLPVYPLTEDLRPEHLRATIKKVLQRHAADVVDILPESLRGLHDWPSLAEALREIHQPRSLAPAQRARRRCVYEEFLVLQMALGLRRREIRDRQKAPRLPVSQAIDERIRRLFPFALTQDQNTAINEVCRDLASDRPMQRLLQADVGAGKTAVAVYALLVTVANKHQAALMAPTEVLARQHFSTLEGYLQHSRVRRRLLTGSLTARERRETLDALAAGEVDLIVGTQALLQEDVQFARLGLVVIDEQHKFGVNQRAQIRRLGVDPHYLIMTATPIPRTVALTVFGDLDVSIIKQLPPGRLPVATRWLPETEREATYERLREGLKQGRQGYIVCPLVDESAVLDVKSAIQTHADLQAGPFREFRLGLLHGQQDEEIKRTIMEQFRAGEIDLLVCTSVVEVGVDVPNATLMLVEHADRFGLSQLHQLRGRISRGTLAGQCYLFGEPATEEGKQRLQTLVRTRDGFALAEADIRLRGMGEFFGTRQHGVGELRLGNPIRDADLLGMARRDAFALLGRDPSLRLPEHALLRQSVFLRYGKSLDLAEIG